MVLEAERIMKNILPLSPSREFPCAFVIDGCSLRVRRGGMGGNRLLPFPPQERKETMSVHRRPSALWTAWRLLRARYLILLPIIVTTLIAAVVGVATVRTTGSVGAPEAANRMHDVRDPSRDLHNITRGERSNVNRRYDS